MSKVLCFGELLLRFSPQLNGAWIKQSSMPVFIGGAELNVATALAKWNIPVSYCTALPQHYLTDEVIAAVQQKGIDCSKIIFSGTRIGTYYLPQGADLKAAGVIYDRAHSSFWSLKRGDINWDKVLEDVSWFHFSAISPALNEDVAAVCLEGAAAAAKKGIVVSVDLNYRAKLWQWGKHPADVMPALVAHCNVVMGNIWAAEKMLNIPVTENIPEIKEAYVEEAQKTSEAIIKQYTACSQVANTFRFDMDAGVTYYATLFQNGQLSVSPEQRATAIVDKIGSGDTFMAGLIYGNQQQLPQQDVINFAAAAAFQKLFIKGDATTASVEEIKNDLLTYV